MSTEYEGSNSLLDTYDFIVIGGGICGLQIGALCSSLGKVLLLEKTSDLGGRVRILNHKGFLLEWGPHPVRFGPRSAIARTLRDIGVKNIKFIKPKIMYAYMNDGSKQIFPSSIKSALKTRMIPKLKTARVFLKLYKDYKKNPKKYLEMSLNEFFKQYNVDIRIQKFILIASASMQVNPFADRSSIGELLENFKQVLKKRSVYYPDGGWSVFIKNLKEKIERSGGNILLNTEVKKIIVDNKIAKGVEVIIKGESKQDNDAEKAKIENEATITEMAPMHTIKGNKRIFYGKRIISAIPIQNLFNILDPSLCSREFVEKSKSLRPTAGISIDFCLSRVITDETLIFIEDPPSFGFIPSNLSKIICPNGKSIMSFFMPTNLDVIMDKEKRQLAYQKFKNKIFAIYPKIKDNIEFERPLFLSMVDGVEIATDQNRLNRPKNDEHGINNLYLTGDSIGGEGAGGDIGHNSVREIFKKIKIEFKNKGI
ncbi:MAG: phytoene desaturase family protein [Promethearchaeota archaeon]